MESKTYLLDTQVALWLILGREELNWAEFTKRFLETPSRFVLHQASVWEIQIKHGLGKLKLPNRPSVVITKAIQDGGFEYRRIEDDGIFFLEKLPAIHRDPFDRLLIAHALAYGWSVITSDSTFEKYPLRVELLEKNASQKPKIAPFD